MGLWYGIVWMLKEAIVGRLVSIHKAAYNSQMQHLAMRLLIDSALVLKLVHIPIRVGVFRLDTRIIGGIFHHQLLCL